MDTFYPTDYTLQCVATGEEFDDSGWLLDCPHCDRPSLIRTQYAQKQLHIYNENNLYKYRDWLPMRRELHCQATHATYRSEGLARALGLQNLYNHNAIFVAVGACADGVGLALLERAGGHRGTSFWEVTVKCDVEILQAQSSCQTLASVGCVRGLAVERPSHGKPIAIFVESVFVADVQLLFGIFGAN